MNTPKPTPTLMEDLDAVLSWVPGPNFRGEKARLRAALERLEELEKGEAGAREQELTDETFLHMDLEKALRAERDAERSRATELAATLQEVLETFAFSGHPGKPCKRSDWVPVERLEGWRAILSTPAADLAAYTDRIRREALEEVWKRVRAYKEGTPIRAAVYGPDWDGCAYDPGTMEKLR